MAGTSEMGREEGPGAAMAVVPGSEARSSRPARPRGARGFTLVELMIVVAMIGILMAIAVPQFRQAPQRAREAALKTDLHVMREAIDQYFADKARYPESLQTLVEEGYIRKVPKDPFTDSDSTWKLIYSGQSADGGGMDEDLLPEEEEAPPGIWDVQSGANYQALDGTYVGEW